MFNLFKKKTVDNKVCAPVNGRCISLDEVNDEIFSSRMLGQGVAFVLEDQTVYSPVNGKISAVADTKHAIGITGDNGVELLIHVGLDTVNLNGDGFEVLVKNGGKVKKGTPLMNIDKEMMEGRGIDLTTCLIISNSGQTEISYFMENIPVEAGKTIVLECQARG